ncbi:MAG: BolA/IbaG family iron-sulfur metabolism protein [Pseudomonadota bacterium]
MISVAMDIEAIKILLEQHFPDADIEADFEGSHLNLVITSERFKGLMPVKKQQLVYAALNEKIASGEVHAVNMKTLVPSG